MAYFRAFTLRDDVDCGAPLLRDFRAAHWSRVEAPMERLRGGTPCEETKRYVQNYTRAADMRPATDEYLIKREDELHINEDLDPTIVDAAARRRARVGGASIEKTR